MSDSEYPAPGDIIGQREADGSLSIHEFSDLEYYLGYRPNADLIAEAEDWQQNHPGSSLSEWVDAMKEIGAI